MPNFIGLTSMSISVAVHWYKSSFQFVFLGGVFCWQLNRAIAANASQHALRDLGGRCPLGCPRCGSSYGRVSVPASVYVYV